MEFISALLAPILALFGIGITVPAQPVVEAEVQATTTELVEKVEAEPSGGGVVLPPDDLDEFDMPQRQDLPEERIGNTSEEMSDEPTELPNPPDIKETTEPDIRTMLVAGGCFWCVEADLEKTKGVIKAVSGYAGGTTENPTYQDYGKGGHREVVEVTYDANQISFEGVLIVTMKTTDPTDDDGTFGDRGDKYSSAFYYDTDEQKQVIEDLIAEVDEYGPYDKPLAIDIEERPTFWPAEDYHQDYYKGLLTQVKYNAYRTASGRTAFIEKYWGVNDHSPTLPWRNQQSSNENITSVAHAGTYMWSNYIKPSKEELKQTLDPTAYRVTQEDGTERAGTSPLDKNYEPGIYVDILSGEPLYSSKDKYDSTTGWPSFTKPITPDALTLHEDRKLFTVRTETRSAIADNHLGHVFDDGPADKGGKRYCMNGAALEFVPLEEMEARGYGDFIKYVE